MQCSPPQKQRDFLQESYVFLIFTLGYCSEKTKKNQAIDATRQHKRPEKASDKLYLAYIYIANSRP